MGVFSTIKNYAIAMLVGLMGILYVKTKYQEAEIEDLEEDNAHHEKLEEITGATEKAERESEAKETEARKGHKEDDWRGQI